MSTIGTTEPWPENLDAWLKATTQSIARSRATLTLACVVGILVIIATFNLYFTWLRDILDRSFDLHDPRQRAMFDNAMRVRFFDTAVMNVPFLGVRVFSGDINLVGAIAVNVMIAWMANAFRKSNHSLGRLLQRAGFHYQDGRPKIGAGRDLSAPSTYLFHVLSSEYLFINAQTDDVASRLMSSSASSRRSGFQVEKLLIWIPAFSLMFAFAADLISMFFKSVLVPTTTQSVRDATSDQLWLVRIVAIPLLGLIYATIKTSQTAAYQRDSQELFDHLSEAVEPHWQAEVRRASCASDPPPGPPAHAA
ncbi:hypothetical protein SAMN02745121_07521 [Nannocystis exedens]|uniref:Uncharacterized protein n=1 Tax=Nannocystis exedens TaxID=54 RepID=A0A1I2GWU5_9BACT|nr:hypothetical protein [Nannocystis exedens]PCC74080.1 hypothetical protein NAEX_07169 [Nannocystis exedens]SFF21041.1 hypothetical protein SAMN02745121_07521 [Nannocystis exedens]